MKSRKKYLCHSCDIDTGKIYEHYFIHTLLWLSVMPSIKGMLCIACLESKLKRKLNKTDFPAVSINNPKICKMSDRLRTRIQLDET